MEQLRFTQCSNCHKTWAWPESYGYQPLCEDCRKLPKLSPKATVTIPQRKVERARISTKKKARR